MSIGSQTIAFDQFAKPRDLSAELAEVKCSLFGISVRWKAGEPRWN